MSRLMIALAAFLLLIPGCGDDSPTGPGSPGGSLAFTRADETTLAIGGPVVAWCGMWEEGEVPVPSIIIQQAGRTEAGYWQVRAVLADVAPGHPIPFPNTFIWNQPRGADIFVYDAVRGNELSSQTEESTGWIQFTRSDCGEGGVVEFIIDAVIGSELGGMDPIRVSGTLRAQLAQNRRR